MKKIKSVFTILSVTFAIMLMPFASIDVHAAEYEIVFKSGLHGSINNEKSVSYKVSGGDIFPNEPVVIAEDGYVFNGWNKELPTVGASVDGKQVYVAQYDVLVSGISYIVRYVDENNVDIATPKAMVAEDGKELVERAKIVPGYTYEQPQLSLKLSSQNKTLTFIYKLTNPNEVISFVNENVDVEQAGTNNPNTPDNTPENANPENEGNQENEEVENEQIQDEETPLANGNEGNSWTNIAVGLCAVALAGGLLFLYLKRKKDEAKS